MNHIPVMLEEVIHHLSPESGKTYIDCTFGAGGYSRKILESCDCKLYAIDQDPSVNIFVKQLAQDYPKEKFSFIKDNFSNIKEIAIQNHIGDVDGIVFDLGISSMQVDQAERGFSFNKEAMLDMRMSQSGKSAWEVINQYSEEDIADIIYYYGEEPFSRHIAKKIIESRKNKTIDTTIELANIIKSAVRRKGKTDPATKSFQAIRVYINDELKVLKKSLVDAYNLLKTDGKLVIVSFQGLEDRIIKEFISNTEGTRNKSYKPSSNEIRLNPRSRSAKLRCIKKIGNNND
jgi:16S rRNA (cytosine1402-N4)-methyltransferase